MPIGRKPRILRMIENGDGDRLVAHEPAQITPTTASSPSGVALFPLTRKIGAVDSSVIQLCNGSGAAARIGIHLWLIRRNFQRPNHPKPQHAVFFIRERNFLIERPQGSDAVYAPKVRPSAKHKMRM